MSQGRDRRLAYTPLGELDLHKRKIARVCLIVISLLLGTAKCEGRRNLERDPGAVRRLKWLSGGTESHPTVYIGGELLVEPTIRELVWHSLAAD